MSLLSKAFKMNKLKSSVHWNLIHAPYKVRLPDLLQIQQKVKETRSCIYVNNKQSIPGGINIHSSINSQSADKSVGNKGFT